MVGALTLTRRALAAGALCLGAAQASGAQAARADAAGEVLATGLRFPEGPVVDRDGSLIVCEIEAGRITRISPDGSKAVIARPGGGPNGLAFGPGGALFCTNNGGFAWTEERALLLPGGRSPANSGPRIERIDPRSGEVRVLYAPSAAAPLSAPNDLVFDPDGGFWFTDSGASTEHGRDHGAIYYARADGSMIERVVGGLILPNGVALSPDNRTLYVSLTFERQILAFDITGPGRVGPGDVGGLAGRVVLSLPGREYLDSLRMQADGDLAVAVLVAGEIVVATPDGRIVSRQPAPDRIPTSVGFGGADMRDAFITLGTSGRVLRRRWPSPGLKLNFQPR